MQNTRNILLAKAHIAAAEIGLDEELRRDFIAARFGGRRSCKDLSDLELRRLLDHFREHGWMPAPPKEQEEKPSFFKKRLHHWMREFPHDRAGMATPQQLAMIEAKWQAVSVVPEIHQVRALRKFLFSRFKVSDLMFLDEGTASRVIEGMKSMGQRAKSIGQEAHGQEVHC